MLKAWMIRINNAIAKRRTGSMDPGHILLLLPRCIQWAECPQNVCADSAACKACGRCQVGAIRALAARHGVRCVVAGGGRKAVEAVRRPETRAVIAVACENELLAGIGATLNKPVLAIGNLRPNGYCNNTAVDIAAVEAAIEAIRGGATINP